MAGDFVNIGHILHPAALQGSLPGDPLVLAVRVTQTKRSPKFLIWLKMGEARMPPVAV